MAEGGTYGNIIFQFQNRPGAKYRKYGICKITIQICLEKYLHKNLSDMSGND